MNALCEPVCPSLYSTLDADIIPEPAYPEPGMQEKEDIQKLAASPAFRQMLARTNRVTFALSAITLLLYSLFFIAIAWFPEWMGSTPLASSTVSMGIWLTMISVVISVILSGFYTWWAIKYFDQSLQDVIRNSGVNEN